MLNACHRSISVFSPEVSHFDPIFDELPADAKMAGNFVGRTAGRDKPAQRAVRNQGGGADSIRRFFIVMIVIASKDPFLAAWWISGYNCQTVWRVTKKNMRDFFH